MFFDYSLFKNPSLKKYLKEISQKCSCYFSPYKKLEFIGFVLLGYVFLFLTYDISNAAGRIATRFAGPAIPDTFFNLLPKIDTVSIHSTLSWILFDVRNIFLLFFPTRILFALFSLGTLVLTRALFINMTHLGIPDGAHPILSSATFGGDLFFSGHTAYPFLLALIFWNIRSLRFLFLGLSVLFGASAILGRYHYTIDVFAAPFITYGVYIGCRRIFEFFQIEPFSQK